MFPYLGLMPLMLFGGKLWFAMTVVIASGLAVGTILTLGVVRVLYSLFFDFQRDSQEEVKAVGTS